ncbi:MAG: hypothetical protein ACRCU2_22320 [Planktothrix sp.]
MKREALVVGINKYAHHPHLDSPARDRVSDSQQVYQDTLSEAITNLLYPKTQQPQKLCCYFFAGHGFRQGQGEQSEGFLADMNAKPVT